MKDYFVKVFDNTPDRKEATVIDVKYFYNLKDLFEWMMKNREELYCVYEADCILDLS